MRGLKAVKERVPVSEAAQLLGLSPNERGKVACPFHDDATPSLHLYDDHWYAYCCGKQGDVVDLVQAFLPGTTLPEAVELLERQIDLSKRAPIRRSVKEIKDFTDRFNSVSKPVDSSAYSLMKYKGWHRLFTTDQLNLWGVRLHTHHPLMLIPHINEAGGIVGVKTRSLVNGEKSAWTGSTFTTRPYTPERRPHSAVSVVCEGESDAWALTAYYQPDEARIFALPSGAHSWRDAWAATVSASKEVWLMLDHDEAGDGAEERVRASIPKAVRVQLPENDVVATLLEGWHLPSP